MQRITIYTTKFCPYCVRAKALLQEKGLSYTEIHVDEDEKERDNMVALSGRLTVPQIFFDDKHIGGYEDLYAYFNK